MLSKPLLAVDLVISGLKHRTTAKPPAACASLRYKLFVIQYACRSGVACFCNRSQISPSLHGFNWALAHLSSRHRPHNLDPSYPSQRSPSVLCAECKSNSSLVGANKFDHQHYKMALPPLVAATPHYPGLAQVPLTALFHSAALQTALAQLRDAAEASLSTGHDPLLK